jgi:predicted transcriptional regulator YdeE
MQVEYRQHEHDIIVIGPAIRTSQQSAAQDIPAFWQRVMRDQVLEPLARRADDPALYAVYCDYDSDHRGAYTMMIGVAADPQAPVPAGMRRAVIPRGRYAGFVARGEPSQAFWQTWNYISETWERRGERRYAADYERYSPAALAAMMEGRAEVDVVVGMR